MRGKLLGERYRITRRIGEGGMAYVYQAKDEKLNRQVAIKILHKHMADNVDIRQRFFQEAHAISALDHPNILKLFDFSGKHSEDLWMVMEVLQGLNLNEYVHTFPGNWLHPVIAAMITREILKALQAAHEKGLIHRDVKPENIFVLNGGGIKLMDFGIVKDTRSNSITMTGTFMGSPSYMSPEQIRGKSVDHRSDVYSLGVLFYEIVTGRLPYTGNTTHDVVMKICEGQFKEPREFVPNLPDDLNKIISKAMAKHPMHRYQEARTFARDLDIFLRSHSFEESHIELERYFADKHKFEDRLRNLAFTNKGTLHTSAPLTAAPAHPSSGSPAPRAKTTRTQYLNKADQLRAAAQQANDRAIDNPIPKSRVPIPPTPPATARAPRRDHQVPRKNSYPNVSRKLAFTQNKAALNPTVMDPTPATVRQRINRAQQKQHPGQLQKRRARPRVPKRQASHAVYYRRSVYRASNQWMTPLLGAFLVGLVGLLSILGFSTLIDQMPTKKSEVSRETPVSAPKPRPLNPPPTVVKDPKVVEPAVEQSEKTSRRAPKERATAPKSRRPASRPANHSTRRPLSPVAKPETPPTQRRDDAPRVEPSKPVKEEEQRKVEPPQTAVAANAQIRLSSRPAAEIYIDGKRRGTTVDRTLNSGWLEIPAGSHRIELRRTGYRTYSTRLTFSANEKRTFPTITLEPDTNFMLTLSSNQKPVKVLLIGLSDRSRRMFVLRGSARGQVLPAGRYRARFEYQGRTIERNITLGGSQSDYNLNVDF